MRAEVMTRERNAGRRGGCGSGKMVDRVRVMGVEVVMPRDRNATGQECR